MADVAREVPVEELIENARKKFSNTFNRTPTVTGIAPGRVNIIGEHTDYNEGFVFPMVRTGGTGFPVKFVSEEYDGGKFHNLNLLTRYFHTFQVRSDF
jgi:galactokinase